MKKYILLFFLLSFGLALTAQSIDGTSGTCEFLTKTRMDLYNPIILKSYCEEAITLDNGYKYIWHRDSAKWIRLLNSNDLTGNPILQGVTALDTNRWGTNTYNPILQGVTALDTNRWGTNTYNPILQAVTAADTGRWGAECLLPVKVDSVSGDTTFQFVVNGLCEYDTIIYIQDINNSYTTGSLLFAGSNGQVEEINSQLFYDSTGKHLGIRTDNPTAAALEISGLSGTGDFPLLMRGNDRGAGNGTDYLTYFDNSIPALYTNGYITINGENTGGDFVQQNIVGISNYMLGIKSDVGANPTVLISTSTGRLIDGRDGAGNEIWNVDALGNVQVGSSANSYINIGSNVASQALLELKNGSFFSYFGGEAFPRLEMSRNQGLRLGDGLTTPDVRLYRSAANTLRTPDNLIVDGTISGTIATGFVTGSVVIQGGSTIAETSSLFFDNSNKRLGIGTNTPSSKLHISDPSFATFRMTSSSSAVDEKNWEWQTGVTAGGGLLRLRAIGDGVTPSNNALIINRTGTTIDNFSMQGDIYANQVGKGFVTKSADGNCWRITVDNAGVLTTTAIACP